MRYKSYKEVDLPWLGEVPEHWESVVLKKVTRIYTGNSIPDDEKNNYINSENARAYISTKDIDKVTNNINYNNGMYIKVNDDKFKIAELGSTLVCIEGGSGGEKIGYVKENVSFGNKLCCIKSTDELKDKYIYYSILSNQFKDQYKMSITGDRNGVSLSKLSSFLFLYPPKEEQEQIARFLDWKINEIDRLILYKKENIAKNKKIWDIYLKKILLKENETIKLKYISHVIPGKEIKEEVEYRENAVPVYGSSNTPFKYTTESLIDGKYIIFGRKGTIGKPYRLDGKFWIIDTAYAVKNNDLVEFDFLYYLFNVINWSKFTTQTALPSIVANEVMQEKVYFPSKKTQKDISEKLKDIEGKIENANIIIKKQIEKLKLLKESLIADVVTGKIDARNVEIPDYEEVKIEEIEELEEEVSYGN
ncbi:restriction endonuclease subunit S [Streptococcus phocae subsp. phocae]